MWSTIWSKIVGFASSLSNPSDYTTEMRLVCFGLVVLFGIIFLSVDLYLVGRIDQSLSNSFLGLCTLVSLGAISMRRPE
jgi:hypothetical protein